jgi:hypothetical protein
MQMKRESSFPSNLMYPKHCEKQLTIHPNINCKVKFEKITCASDTLLFTRIATNVESNLNGTVLYSEKYYINFLISLK